MWMSVWFRFSAFLGSHVAAKLMKEANKEAGDHEYIDKEAPMLPKSMEPDGKSPPECIHHKLKKSQLEKKDPNEPKQKKARKSLTFEGEPEEPLHPPSGGAGGPLGRRGR